VLEIIIPAVRFVKSLHGKGRPLGERNKMIVLSQLDVALRLLASFTPKGAKKI
jgi:hypothetical protein